MGGPATMNGISPEILYLLDPAQGLCIPEGNIDSSDIGELESETRGRRPIRVTHHVKQATSEDPGVFDRFGTSNVDRSSMYSKWNKRQVQMTFRESDDCVVPKQREDPIYVKAPRVMPSQGRRSGQYAFQADHLPLTEVERR